MVAFARPSERLSSAFDPDAYRMSIGEHLEELRRRLAYGLVGFAVAMVVCLAMGHRLTEFFIAPYIRTVIARGLNPQMAYREMAEVFTVTIKVATVCALVLSGPWLLFQFWRFIAAGLYPHERKHVTRYLPLSITLLVGGVLFVYFLVLPWTISFLLGYGESFRADNLIGPAAKVDVADPKFVSVLQGDPARPLAGQVWINALEHRMKYFDGKQVMAMWGGSGGLLMPQITLADYIDTVLIMLLTFALSFQLPLVVLALERVGMVRVETLKAGRRYVYLIVAIIAAAITPGDFVGTMLALAVPLALLYELGIWLATFRPSDGGDRSARYAS
jgi:sec-independent protein translocase protein TatC